MYGEFQRIGRELVRLGLISSHAGNLSARKEDSLYITRRGCMLGDLQEGDIVETTLDHDDSGVAMASTEMVVHRAIYRATSAQAIVHCHPPSAIALSLGTKTIVPVDSEGAFLLHQVPVVTARKPIGSEEVAELLPPLLKEHRIVMLRGHGSFAIGQALEQALMLSSSLEVSSKIIVIANMMGTET